MKIFMLFLLTPVVALAACPENSMEVEYVSPITFTRKITCGFMQKGEMIKHGPETEYDKDGKVIKVTEFNNGEAGKAMAITPPPSTSNLPGAEEATKKFEEDIAFSVIGDLLKVLSYEKSGLNEGQFKVGHCDPNPKAWVIAAVTKMDLKKTYSNNERCDVSGSFTASFKNEFPVQFSLRNLKNFTSTTMNVKMNLAKGTAPGEIRYKFEARDSVVSSSEKSIMFNAQYEVTVDSQTGVTKFDTQAGKITLLKVGDKTMNIERPLVFNR